MNGLRISEATLKRIRDYVTEEPSFTCTFAAWDMSRTGKKITAQGVRYGVDWLLAKGVVELIEDGGRMGKVYAYVQPKPVRHISAVASTATHFPELDESRRVGEMAPARGVVVPHTRVRGRSGKPGKDTKRQANGVRIKKRTA